MGFWNKLWSFFKANAERHLKRISISIGAFLLSLVVSIPLGVPGYYYAILGSSITFAEVIIMSIFGKNGNGETHTEETEEEEI